MTKLTIMRRDQGGAAVIEFAIALPLLVSFIYGIFQFGLLFQANAGVHHALGEGARSLTLFPTPTDAQVKQTIADEMYGKGDGTLTIADPVSGAGFRTLSVTYSKPMNFLFTTGPTITFTRTKRVYVTV
jgi:Flp pilus assembly protein TadG